MSRRLRPRTSPAQTLVWACETCGTVSNLGKCASCEGQVTLMSELDAMRKFELFQKGMSLVLAYLKGA